MDSGEEKVKRKQMKISEKWDRKYLELAKYVADNWSRDPSTKVGAILVNYEHNKEFIGYNGFPRGVNDAEERYNNRELKYKMITHAEINAILKAGGMSREATLYVYPSFVPEEIGPCVCNECAKFVIQSGIKEIVSYTVTPDKIKESWIESIKISAMMCEEAGVTWRSIKE